MANASRARFQRILDFLDDAHLATQDQRKVPWWRRSLHFWILVVRSFVRNRAPVRASALAYTTLLALIPVLAVVVSISSIFPTASGEKPIEHLIARMVQTVAPQLGLKQDPTNLEDTAKNEQVVVQNILAYVNNMSNGKLGATAGIALIFVGISLLSTIESTFNDMWGVTRGRTWLARIIQYWAALTLGPLFLVTALGLTTSAQFGTVRNIIQEAPLFGSLVFKALPFVVLAAALTLFYKLIPNTRVLWMAALAGGIVGGVALQANSVFSVIYLSKVVSYSKVYGSMGAVPIFLIGMYFSWLIVLFGAQVSYAFQNRLAYLQELEAESVNQQGREFVALRIMTFITQRFEESKTPPTKLEISQALGVPSQLTAQVICPLVCAKLLIEVMGDEVAGTGYAPARPVEKISVEDVLTSLRAGQGRELATTDDPARAVVREQYERVMLAEMQVANAVNLRTIASRVATASKSLPQKSEESKPESAP